MSSEQGDPPKKGSEEPRRTVTVIRREIEEKDDRPAILKSLFDIEGSDLTMLTETPSRLIIPLVVLKCIREMDNPERTKPLVEIFIEELDRRMISKDRKGRIEAIEVLKATQKDEHGIDLGDMQ